MPNASTMYVNNIAPRDAAAVLFPNKPSFLVTRNDANLSTVLGVVPFNLARHNIGNHFNLSGYYFTAPITGTYHFSGQVYYNDGAGYKRIGLRLNQSTFVSMHSIVAVGNDESISFSIDLYLTAGDKIDLASDQTVSRTIYYTGGVPWNHTYLSGYLVG